MHMVTLQGNQPVLSLNVVMKETRSVQFPDWTVTDMTATGKWRQQQRSGSFGVYCHDYLLEFSDIAGNRRFW